MGLSALHINEVARLNASAGARVTQALKLNDFGTAQRIAASVAMSNGQVSKPAASPPPAHKSEHQVDVWA